MRWFSSSDRSGSHSWCAALNDSRRPTKTVISLVLFCEFSLAIEYAFVCGYPEPAGRDEAAAAVGIGRAPRLSQRGFEPWHDEEGTVRMTTDGMTQACSQVM